MLTTGTSAIDKSIQTAKLIKSSHKVIAEWNQNAYNKISYAGSYPINLSGTTSDPDYSETFASNYISGGWDNGGYYHVIDGTTETYVENLERKKIFSLANVVSPERPDPGIINGFPFSAIDSNASSSISIISDATSLRIPNVLQAENRMYAANETQGFKYWTSVRYPMPNSSKSIISEIIGVSDSNLEMKGNNAFVVYDQGIYTNKIVIKTQTVNGYPDDFKVQVIDAADNTNTWTTVFTENASARTSRSITKTGSGTQNYFTITLNNHDNLYIGMSVTGTGIASGTKISKIYADGVIEVDKALTSTISSQSLSFVDHPLSDGILRLTANRVSGSIVWSIAGGVENEATTSDLNKSTAISGNVTKIKAIRFISNKLSRENGTLDIIEISPRLVVNITKYISSFNIDSSIGDSVLGLPVGSIVTSSGSIQMFNYDEMLTNKNSDSMLFNLLKPNVKFTFLNKIEYTPTATEKYVPVKVMYSREWDETGDWSVNLNIEDYFSFLRAKQAPDILLGALDGIKVSAIIKILLDNAGFNKFSFEKTGENDEYQDEDTRIDFFYSSKEYSIAEVLDGLARSAQLSMFIDQFGNLVAKTKESVIQKTDLYDYWLVGDYKSLVEGDAEYLTINENYISNIESFEDSIEPPITDGEVQYSSLGIEKSSSYLLEQELNANPGSISNTLDYGFSEISLTRSLSYKPSKIWTIGEGDSSTSSGILSAGILLSDIGSTKPNTYLTGQTFEALNKNDAIRQAFNSLDSTERKDAEIVIAENNLVVGFLDKLSGYVLVDAELIKYNGIKFAVSKVGYSSYNKIYFSRKELDGDIALAPTGSSFVPYSLIVDLDMQVYSYPTADTGYVFFCKNDGRGQNGTSVSSHLSGINKANGWSKFAAKMLSSSTVSNLGQSLTIAIDSGIPDLQNPKTNVKGYGGYAKLVGPPSTKTGSAQVAGSIADNSMRFKDVGEQWVSGFKRDVGFIPSRFGTRMNVFINENAPETVCTRGGISFFMNGSSGYYVEVATASAATNSDGTPYDNITLYKISGSNHTPKIIGTASCPVTEIVGTEDSIIYDEQYMSLTYESVKSIINLDVVVTGNKSAGSTKTFIVRIDGTQVMKVTDKDSLASTEDIGIFVRDDSTIILDNVYATTIPYNYTPSDNNKDYALFENAIANKSKRGALSPIVAALVGTPQTVFYDDFGNAVREVRKVDARFNEPVFDSRLIELSEVSPDYFIKDFKSTSFGASFWIYNTSSGIVKIGEGAELPIFISGIALKKVSGSTIKISQFIDKQTEKEYQNNTVNINRRLYGSQSVDISGDYLNNSNEAENLAEWIAKYATQEKIKITASIFPNPLLQLGDKVKVFYKKKGYTTADIGDKTYILSSISYVANENGIEMNVELREML